MRIWAIIFGFSFLLLNSCSQKRICAAYQSSFIYDKESLRKKFSYFTADTTPKVFLAASKSKYLIAVPESYRKKYQRLQTIEMKPVYPTEPDSVRELQKLLAESDSVVVLEKDSVHSASGVDESGLVQKSPDFKITKTKEKYNHDQEYYMWFFRRHLVLPDIKYHLNKKASGTEEPATTVNQVKSVSKNPVKASAETKKRSPLKLPSLKNRTVADTLSRNKKN